MKKKTSKGIPCGNMREFDEIMDPTSSLNMKPAQLCDCEQNREDYTITFCQLHAAAPELLDALISISREEPGPRFGREDKLRRIQEIALAAIARAKGGNSYENS